LFLELITNSETLVYLLTTAAQLACDLRIRIK
jgi:hypothetical protein